MSDPRPSTPVPDPVTTHLNCARAEIVTILKRAEKERPQSFVRALAFATADALLAIVVAVEELARRVRK